MKILVTGAEGFIGSHLVEGLIKKRYKVIVVSSAMAGETNKLVKLTKQISNNFISSEYDQVVE